MTIDRWKDIANSIFAADPEATAALIELRVPCNRLLANHSTVTVGDGDPVVGILGILTHMDVERAGDPDWCWINALSGEHDDMGRPCPPVPTVHWVIAGGESGPNARPMHPDWARSLRDECQAAGVPFFFKQWGEWRPMEESDHDSTLVKGWPDDQGNLEPREKWVARVGKHKAGRLLDGRTWDEFPEVRA